MHHNPLSIIAIGQHNQMAGEGLIKTTKQKDIPSMAWCRSYTSRLMK